MLLVLLTRTTVAVVVVLVLSLPLPSPACSYCSAYCYVYRSLLLHYSVSYSPRLLLLVSLSLPPLLLRMERSSSCWGVCEHLHATWLLLGALVAVEHSSLLSVLTEGVLTPSACLLATVCSVPAACTGAEQGCISSRMC